ncbi:rhodanese-like domain-containing protein [Desulfuromonas carbonis]|uniref:rhodanese-like domain-containing protein n=1 Tax=Desulfuromonas sp. DDH964 TaxID=1823759 RepID=UPI00078B4C81|nr:rhodanese-like domain-containing protein [Desulfuromonas sp. DDH964]AMV71520.1 sulfurtransferase [Desulfuromonas sp. DDH964]
MQARELARQLKSKQPPVVVDVRSGFEYRAGHIPGAIHAPALQILLRLAKLPADKGTQLVVTCEHGPRAQLGRTFLALSGYRNVELLDGHMNGWRRAGLPLAR